MQEIGGFFELELCAGYEWHKNALRLNSARSCLRYLIKAAHIEKLWLPQYTCPIIFESAEREGIKIEYYSINTEMLPNTEFEEDDFVLYTNYFGLCGSQIDKLSAKYKYLIIDNSQGFFEEAKGFASFYSPRKFFGVPDGGYLYCPKEYEMPLEQDISVNRYRHLLNRLEFGAEKAYCYFTENEQLIDTENIKWMSLSTRKLLDSIDYKRCIERRKRNFEYLHTHLKDINDYAIKTQQGVPMVYPLLVNKAGIREKLIENKIFIPTYWKGQRDKEYGAFLEQYLIPLPIDQRYTIKDMRRIVECIDQVISKD